MVTGTHPEEIELFDYVEGDVSAGRRAEIEVHLATCGPCADQVARVQAGRDALRDSQFLHLPPRRRDAIFMNLPERRRAPGRSPALSPKRLLAILTPVAAVAAVVVALVSTGDLGSDNSGQSAGTAGGGGMERSAVQDQGEGAPTTASKALRLVAGPADQVVSLLRSKGIDARAVARRVEVRNATRQKVDRALADRPNGGVEIVIVK